MSVTPGVGWANAAVFQLGKKKTLAVPMEVHEMSRKKMVEAFAANGITTGITLFKGGEQQLQYDSDVELVFRQDSWFNYLFGVKEAGVYGTVNLSNGKSALFIPKLPEEYRIWCGEILPPSSFKASYAVDEVFYIEDLATWIDKELDQVTSSGGKLHLMNGVNADSGTELMPARYDGDKKHWESNSVDTTVLYNLLSNCRVTKCAQEIDVMRYAAYVASNAHVEVMRAAKDCCFEYELEAKFQYEIYRNGGCRKCAYTNICACGPNNAVLHYGHAGAPNDRELQSTDMALLDMGAEYHGYVSDITCSFPIAGTFSADQRAIYEGVLEAQKAVLAVMVPGTLWTECHRVAERAIVSNLLKIGILHNGSVDEMVESCIGGVFMPHGLGHLIGCDTHDVGGYLPGEPQRMTGVPGLGNLRTARKLKAGMVLTNEPGCYFIDALLDAALANPKQSKYINPDILARFRRTGGVRLEDVVLVHEDTERGAESLSTCPRTVEEVEAVMSGDVWPPAVDKAPYLKRQWTKLAANGHGMENDNVAVAAL